MTDSVIIAKSEVPKGSPAYEACNFSLAPWQKQQLQEKLHPFLGKKLEEVDKESLAKIIEDALPPQVIPQIKKTLVREIDAPVVIHNLPEATWDKTFSQRAEASKKDALTHSYSFWITQGILELTGCRSSKSALFLRKGLDDGFEPPYEVHRDINPVSILSCLHNPIHAPTQFIDMRAALASLSSDIKDRLHIEPIPALGITSTISLNKLEPKLESMRYNDKDIPHGIVLHSLDTSSASDVAAYDNAMKNHMIEVDLQPGTLVVWDTAYHRARSGKVETVDPTGYTRAAMFAGAGRPI